MTTGDLLRHLAARHIAISAAGDRLRVEAACGVITAEIRQMLRQRKTELLSFLGPTTGREADSGCRSPAAAAPATISSTPVLIDLETRSACDIAMGGRRYAEHPTTGIMSVAAKIDGRIVAWCPLVAAPLPPGELWPGGFTPVLPVESYCGPELPLPLVLALAADRPFCAHNAWDFDQHVWRAQGLPEPAVWIDTLPAARAAGYPGKLDQLGMRLLGRGKDPEGLQVLLRLQAPDRSGEFRPLSREDGVLLLRYNIADVLLLEHVYRAVEGIGEHSVLAADRAINNRGIAFDCDLARRLVLLEAELTAQARQEAEDATQGVIKVGDLRRDRYILGWIRSQGVEIRNLKKETVADLLKTGQGIPGAVRRMLEARQTANRVSAAKLERAIQACDADGRIRGLLEYYGAHTGRWTGHGVQPQNLPRPHAGLTDLGRLLEATGDLEAFRRALPPGVKAADAISTLVRPCFRASAGKVLCVADLAGIEARGVAWCADEQRQLEQFAQGGDNYCDLAAQIFGRPITRANKREREVGKVAVLGCGYEMSARRFAETCMERGVDLAAANTTADEVVESYRGAYPAIAGIRVENGNRSWREGGLWRAVDRAARDAIAGGTHAVAGKCEFYMEDAALVIRLPSGRRIFYRNAHIEDIVPGYCRTLGLPEVPKPTIVFDGPKIPSMSTYGGKLTENLVQGICRDLLAQSLVECEATGLPVVLHVHDEVVVEVEAERGQQALGEVLRIMSTPPSWATGFPIEVEGFLTDRYLKTPPNGAVTQRARNGRIL